MFLFLIGILLLQDDDTVFPNGWFILVWHRVPFLNNEESGSLVANLLKKKNPLSYFSHLYLHFSTIQRNTLGIKIPLHDSLHLLWVNEEICHKLMHENYIFIHYFCIKYLFLIYQHARIWTYHMN